MYGLHCEQIWTGLEEGKGLGPGPGPRPRGLHVGKEEPELGLRGRSKWTSLNKSTGTMCLWLTNCLIDSGHIWTSPCEQTDRQTWLKILSFHTPLRAVITWKHYVSKITFSLHSIVLFGNNFKVLCKWWV